MARFGKLPVNLPKGVEVEISPDKVKIIGPRGALERKLPLGIKVIKKEDQLFVEKRKDNKEMNSLQGTIKAHLDNMTVGVTEGWKKVLEIVGAEYKAELKGNDLVLNLGYSNPVVFQAFPGIKFSLEKSVITIEGNDFVFLENIEIRKLQSPQQP